MPIAPGSLPIGAIFGVVAGFGVTVAGLVLKDRTDAAKRWRQVRGKVYAARVVEEVSRDVDERRTTMYRPEIRYEYVVDGHEYASRRLDFLDRAASWRSYAEGVIARYPIGRDVDVFYDPEDPAKSVLERDNAKGWASLLVVVGLMIIAGAVVWALAASEHT